MAEDACRNLVEKLELVRRSCADAPEEERRRQFRQALGEELQGLADGTVAPLLGSVRERLIRDARDRQQHVEQLEGELARLRAENESLKRGSAGTASGGDDSLEKLREGLIQLTENQQATAESLGLPDSQARLFHLFQALLKFAMAYEMGVNLLLAEFRVGPAAEMDTRMMKGFRQLVRDRFRACLDDKQGSLSELQEVLTRNSRFVVDLNRAYTACLSTGSQSLLSEIDPQPVLDKHKRMIGFDYEKAWSELVRMQSDLAGLTDSELWERFYFAAFREKLTDYIET